jgi:erythromycin esterase-like protein
MKGMKVRNHRPELPGIYRMLTLSRDTIEILKNRLTTNKTSYIEASSQSEYEVALRLVEVLSQSFEIGQSDEGYGYSKREQGMAANVEWALNEIDPGPEKAFLWAHNEHVMYGDITERSGKLVGTSLGKILKNKLNGKVYSIGLHFNQGSFIANEIKQDTIVKRVWTVDEVSQNRFPYLLSKTNMDALFMDFHSFQNKNVVSWLTDNRVRGYSVGGAYYPDYPAYNSRSYPLLDCFDGLIFINDTHEITLDLK